MDTDAARRARQKTIKQNLAEAYTDEEASPPEWVELLNLVTTRSKGLAERIADETEAFSSDPDIKRALARRDRVSASIREEIRRINEKIGRLNLLAPHARFTRGALDADETLRPLFRTPRKSGRP